MSVTTPTATSAGGMAACARVPGSAASARASSTHVSCVVGSRTSDSASTAVLTPLLPHCARRLVKPPPAPTLPRLLRALLGFGGEACVVVLCRGSPSSMLLCHSSSSGRSREPQPPLCLLHAGLLRHPCVRPRWSSPPPNLLPAPTRPSGCVAAQAWPRAPPTFKCVFRRAPTCLVPL
jgi:hypothetical protein